MGYTIEINSLLKLPKRFKTQFIVGERIIIEKDGERLYLLHKPLEFCDSNYNYIGKLEINKLIIEKNKTSIEATILSIFSEQDSKVYTKNFIKE